MSERLPMLPPVDPARAGDTAPATTITPELLAGLLADGGDDSRRGHSQSALVERTPLEVFDGLLRSAMTLVGQRWQEGRWTIAEEHLASRTPRPQPGADPGAPGPGGSGRSAGGARGRRRGAPRHRPHLPRPGAPRGGLDGRQPRCGRASGRPRPLPCPQPGRARGPCRVPPGTRRYAARVGRGRARGSARRSAPDHGRRRPGAGRGRSCIPGRRLGRDITRGRCRRTRPGSSNGSPTVRRPGCPSSPDDAEPPGARALSRRRRPPPGARPRRRRPRQPPGRPRRRPSPRPDRLARVPVDHVDPPGRPAVDLERGRLHGLGPPGRVGRAAVLLGQQGRRQAVALEGPELDPSPLAGFPDRAAEAHLGHPGVEDRAERLLGAEATRIAAAGLGAVDLRGIRPRAPGRRPSSAGGGPAQASPDRTTRGRRRAAGEQQDGAGEQRRGGRRGPGAAASRGTEVRIAPSVPRTAHERRGPPRRDGAHRTRSRHGARMPSTFDPRRTRTSLPWPGGPAAGYGDHVTAGATTGSNLGRRPRVGTGDARPSRTLGTASRVGPPIPITSRVTTASGQQARTRRRRRTHRAGGAHAAGPGTRDRRGAPGRGRHRNGCDCQPGRVGRWARRIPRPVQPAAITRAASRRSGSRVIVRASQSCRTARGPRSRRACGRGTSRT